MENPEIKYAPQNEDEIDIFHLLEVVLSKWKYLVAAAIIGLIIGFIAKNLTPPSFTAESKVKVIKQTIDQYEADNALNDHVIKLEGVEIKELLLKDFIKSNKLKDQQANLKVGLSAKFDKKRNPGILFLNTNSNSPKIAVDFLNFVNNHYCQILNKENSTRKELKIKQLEKNKNDFYNRTQELNKKLKKFSPEKVESFEIKLLNYSTSELSYWNNKYLNLEKELQKILAILPSINKMSPADLCSIYKAVCPDQSSMTDLTSINQPVNLSTTILANPSCSINAEYRNKQNKVTLLKNSLKKINKTNPQYKLTAQKLEAALSDLKAFSETTKKQILAKKEFLEAEQKSIVKRIQDIQSFLRNSNKELATFKNLIQQQQVTQQTYNKITEAYSQELNSPLPTYSFEILNNSKIVKNNSKKRLLPVVISPILLVGLLAFAFILFDAYSNYNKTHHKNS